MSSPLRAPALTFDRIFWLWLPLAASTLLMSVEFPVVNSGIARTPNPEISLAAYGLAVNLAVLMECLYESSRRGEAMAVEGLSPVRSE